MNNWGRVNLGAASPGLVGGGGQGVRWDGGTCICLRCDRTNIWPPETKVTPSAPTRHFVPLSGQLSPSSAAFVLLLQPLAPLWYFFTTQNIIFYLSALFVSWFLNVLAFLSAKLCLWEKELFEFLALLLFDLKVKVHLSGYKNIHDVLPIKL